MGAIGFGTGTPQIWGLQIWGQEPHRFGDRTLQMWGQAVSSPVSHMEGPPSCALAVGLSHRLSQAMSHCVSGLTFQLTSAALLSILVFLPSALVVLLLLVRMGRKFRAVKEKGKCGYKKSSIEVSDE